MQSHCYEDRHSLKLLKEEINAWMNNDQRQFLFHGSGLHLISQNYKSAEEKVLS